MIRPFGFISGGLFRFIDRLVAIGLGIDLIKSVRIFLQEDV